MLYFFPFTTTLSCVLKALGDFGSDLRSIVILVLSNNENNVCRTNSIAQDDMRAGETPPFVVHLSAAIRFWVRQQAPEGTRRGDNDVETSAHPMGDFDFLVRKRELAIYIILKHAIHLAILFAHSCSIHHFDGSTHGFFLGDRGHFSYATPGHTGLIYVGKLAKSSW